ncbi:MAG TPA: adenylate/guanylate cyclase domain-containing protein [Thermomicrobiales bacterium]|nr:adenylate/guanylate cyclase domain-containing protein [Thermomicrobiales bacterium]
MSEDAGRQAPPRPRDPDQPPHAGGERVAPPARAAAPIVGALRHELRTPLNQIIGYSELLQEEAVARGLADLLPDLRKVQAAGQRLVAFVDDVLDLAGREAGEPDQERLARELRAPLDTIIGYSDLLREVAAERGHEDFGPDLEKINAAGKRLRGLLTAVLDLAGAGAAEPAGSQDRAPPSRAPARPAAGGETTEPAAVLVVDDNEVNRELLSRRLARDGHAVSVAANGRQALAALEAEPFDLVLLDIMMPELNGYQVLAHLKADRTLRHIPVIVLSSLADLDSVVACIELGAEDYLPKPVDSVLLRARIGACLEKKRLRDREVLHLRQIEEERRRSDRLLHVILPPEIVQELKATNAVRPRRHDHVAVLFADVVGFTAYCDRYQPQDVIPQLQLLVETYEDLAQRHGLQKIKTTGDDFMATAGLLQAVEQPVLNCVRCGAAMIAAAQRLPERWNVRVGIHVGPVVAGVLGRGQYLFDLWGDTVNTAKRLEALGQPGSMTLSRAAWHQVADRCRGEALGAVPIKGKGELEVMRFIGFDPV